MKMRFGIISLALLGALFIACSGGGVPSGWGVDNTPNDQAGPDVTDSYTPQDVATDAVPDQIDEIQPVQCTPGESCDDKDPCTIEDKCGDDGICHGRRVEACDDHLKCTKDACTSDTDCTHELRHGWCLVEGKCYKEGDVDPDNQCMACITSVATDKFTPDDTLSCEDGNECTKHDQCQGGKCVGGPIDCDDNNVCTADSCDEANGKCVHTPVDGSCDDGNVCTVNDTCVDGQCKGQGQVDCDDGNPCTDDTCDPQKGCVHTPNSAPCDDNNKCTENDVCKDGKCQGDLVSCDDNNPCTDDSCVPSKGCVHIPNTAPCDDNNPCTVGDFCQNSKCQPGPDPLNCDDNNVCTDDSCNPKAPVPKDIGAGVDPHYACVHTPNSNPCDDHDVCTLKDFCANSTCQPGPGKLDCDDNNVCTADSCDPIKGCQHENLTGPSCDDDDICTEHDTCAAGQCKGTPVSCDDGNPCTLDHCDAKHGGCWHEADLSKPECRPKIEVDFPPRGATLLPKDMKDGVKVVHVHGKLTVPAAQYDSSHSIHIAKFVANGQPVIPIPDPSNKGVFTFSFDMDSAQGMNVIVIDAQDSLGIKKHLVQSYYFSHKYLNTDASHPADSSVSDGLMLFMGPEVWNTLAGVIRKFVNSMDWNSILPSGEVGTQKVGWCKYHFYVSNFRYNKDALELSLTPEDGYLHMFIKMTDIKIDIKAKSSGFGCPDFKGYASINYMTMSVDMNISVDSSGNPQVTVRNSSVDVGTVKIHGSGFGSSIIAWLANTFFGGTMKKEVKKAIDDAVKKQIGPALASALKALNLDQDFKVPAMLPGMKATTVHLKTRLHSITMKHTGSVVTMNTMTTSQKDPNLGHDQVLGSITRSGCCIGGTDAIAMPVSTNPLELGLHDDMINEVVFAVYNGGSLKFDLTEKDLGQDLSQYGIDHLVMHIDFWLPPIITGCKRPGNKLRVEIGDMGIHATMNLMGSPVEMQLFASAAFDASFQIVDGKQGKELSVKIDDVAFLDVEVASLDGALVGAEDMIRGMIKDQLLPMVIQQIAGKSLGSFPIPAMDLHSMDPSIPAGTVIKIVPQEVIRKNAYTVLSGNMED